MSNHPLSSLSSAIKKRNSQSHEWVPVPVVKGDEHELSTNQVTGVVLTFARLILTTIPGEKYYFQFIEVNETKQPPPKQPSKQKPGGFRNVSNLPVSVGAKIQT